jgi:hypothetical protein
MRTEGACGWNSRFGTGWVTAGMGCLDCIRSSFRRSYSAQHDRVGIREDRLAGLVQLEAKGLGELSLVQVEGVEAVHSEFEGGCDMQ